MNRPSWDEYFFGIAAEVATRGTCPRASIGCVIVHPSSHWILGTGFNGAGAGEAHCTEVGCTILADHCVRATHAEVNASLQVARRPLGALNLIAYVVGGRDVCSHCARELYAVGVRDVRWRSDVPRLDRITREIHDWQAMTFPQATPASVVEHLRREVVELVNDPTDTSELADCYFLLVGLAYELGVDLTTVVTRKLSVNRARTWGQPDEHGVVEHVREVAS